MYVGSFSPEMTETSDRKWKQVQELPARVSVVYCCEDSIVTDEGTIIRGDEGNMVEYDMDERASYVEWDKGFGTYVDPSDVTYL